jgi:hypothetical protein
MAITSAEVDTGILQGLLDVLALRDMRLNQPLGIAGQVTQLADWGWGHKADLQQPVLQQLRQPGGVAHVGHWSTLLGRGLPEVFVVRLGEGWGDGQRRSPLRARKTPPRSSLPGDFRPAIEARAAERQSVTARPRSS